MAHFVQCELQKLNKVMIAWIPSMFARVGKFLELNGDNGWKVNSVHGKIENDYIEPQLWGNKLPKAHRTER